jgi:hypothetical protein
VPSFCLDRSRPLLDRYSNEAKKILFIYGHIVLILGFWCSHFIRLVIIARTDLLSALIVISPYLLLALILVSFTRNMVNIDNYRNSLRRAFILGTLFVVVTLFFMLSLANLTIQLASDIELSQRHSGSIWWWHFFYSWFGGCSAGLAVLYFGNAVKLLANQKSQNKRSRQKSTLPTQ